ncbi:flavin reductase family protein [Streptomyces sp. NPDC056987]|uniref:flavin reductase family protein n=1 Tax=Streptomyces sp. NPDC056987 TaxID=3345988 RepID=UPI003624C611
MTTEQQHYRDLMSAFPTGIAVVTSLDAQGVPRGMTCSSVTSATLSPPTLLVCLRNGSATLDAVSATRGFAVNLLHDGGRHAAEVFSGPDPNRFSRVQWKQCRSGLPWLSKDAFAVAECRVSGTQEVGDHTVVFGEVARIAQTDGTPLLYGLRSFAAWPLPSDGGAGPRPARQGSQSARQGSESALRGSEQPRLNLA